MAATRQGRGQASEPNKVLLTADTAPCLATKRRDKSPQGLALPGMWGAVPCTSLSSMGMRGRIWVPQTTEPAFDHTVFNHTWWPTPMTHLCGHVPLLAATQLPLGSASSTWPGVLPCPGSPAPLGTSPGEAEMQQISLCVSL